MSTVNTASVDGGREDVLLNYSVDGVSESMGEFSKPPSSTRPRVDIVASSIKTRKNREERKETFWELS
jgi:hypothetical protein